MTAYADLIASLAVATGIPQLKPDVNHAVRLILDGQVDLVIQSDAKEETVTIYTTVGTKDRWRFQQLQEMLGANLFGLKTKGATLALEAATGQVLLEITLPLEGLRYAKFEIYLRDFVETAECWQNLLAEESAEEDDFFAPSIPTPLRA